MLHPVGVVYAADAVARAAELVHHYAEAHTALGTENVVQYSLLAGERALAAYAHEEALSHFQRGLTANGGLLIGAEPASDPEQAALLLGMGRVQASTLELHQLPEVVITVTRSFDRYAQAGDVGRALAVAQFHFLSLPGRRNGAAQRDSAVCPSGGTVV